MMLLFGWKVRWRLRQGPDAAAELGPRAVKHLIRALEDPRLRTTAADALVRIGTPARPALLKRLKTRRGAQKAVEVLGRLRPRTDPSPLVPFLQDPSAPMRRTAAKAIARQGGSLSFTVLSESLSDADPGVRRIAVAYLLRSTDPRAIRQMVRLAAHGDEDLSRQAAARIGQLGYLAVGPLVEALRTSDEVLRGTIGYLMDVLEDNESLVILAKALEEDDPRIVEPVRATFLRKGPEVAPILAPLAVHPDARVRKTALGLLARWDSASPVFA
ncbi:MAG: HEAT repeat domain-containing protein [Candidatus Sericytochromatia bacterium]|uniref:HEAT repeat domain-containing protein n=1 Tax=Candidatus Tanganyikabacteria bacterium TaxID=2961651 RepID=A0A937X5B2_9BACT|nr:HEAT repeat domain-containing protein [Candidatus Tanganyikabacteria bacterium]